MSDAKYKQIPTAVGTVTSPDEDKAATETPSRLRSAVRSICKFLLFLCLSCTIVFALLAGAVYHGGHYLIDAAGEYVVPRITSDQPLDLPPAVHLSDAEAVEVRGRIREFRHAIHHGEAPPRDLVLTERDINGLICDKGGHFPHKHNHGKHHHHHHHGKHMGDDMCGKVHVSILDGEIAADFSVPLDDHVAGGEGRYMVGTKITSITAESSSEESNGHYSVRSAFLAGSKDSDDRFPVFDFTGSVEVNSDGELDLQAKSAEVLGWVATDAFLERFLLGQNLAGLFSCPHHAENKKNALKLIKGVEIADGKVVIKVGREGMAEQDEEDEMMETEIGLRGLLRVGNN
eukprot:CAMPEP_0197436250 /NCGR_PEP_ID=MMETSP1175-20131217/3717_1 /TAXON_ID=1003142 /ORGANISM="Triceratium dubium, Strain CCMP147" /LENGTH=344 /DNA_ID=CAMNT_0042965491 /DNA_START=122 /DNA_END=1156 /DNA_ORIENTATION=+